MSETMHRLPFRAAVARRPHRVVWYAPDGHRLVLSLDAARESLSGLSEALGEAERVTESEGGTVRRLCVARRRLLPRRRAAMPARPPAATVALMLPLALALTLLPALGLLAAGLEAGLWLAFASPLAALPLACGIAARLMRQDSVPVASAPRLSLVQAGARD